MSCAGGRSKKIPTAKFHIYQPPPSLRGWPDDHDTEAALRHLGLLDFARLQLPDGVPRHDLVSDLVVSYHEERLRCAYLWFARVSVDRKSFLNATALQLREHKEHKELPPNLHPATVTCAALKFMEIWILPQFQGRDTLPADVSDAMQRVKAGLAHKVDWAQLIWDLVRNEINELPKRDDKSAYFGLHLLTLIWVQHSYVFGLKERVVRSVVEEMERLFRGEASAIVQVQQQPMVVQSSQLATVLNDDARMDKSNSMEPAPVEPGEADSHKHGVKQQFQQGNQQKRTLNRNKCSVPTGSTISTATSSRDIIGIEREVKRARLENQPAAKELLEAEIFIQAVKMLKETISAETILHMLKDSPEAGSR